MLNLRWQGNKTVTSPSWVAKRLFSERKASAWQAVTFHAYLTTYLPAFIVTASSSFSRESGQAGLCRGHESARTSAPHPWAMSFQEGSLTASQRDASALGVETRVACRFGACHRPRAGTPKLDNTPETFCQMSQSDYTFTRATPEQWSTKGTSVQTKLANNNLNILASYWRFFSFTKRVI